MTRYMTTPIEGSDMVRVQEHLPHGGYRVIGWMRVEDQEGMENLLHRANEESVAEPVPSESWRDRPSLL